MPNYFILTEPENGAHYEKMMEDTCPMHPPMGNFAAQDPYHAGLIVRRMRILGAMFLRSYIPQPFDPDSWAPRRLTLSPHARHYRVTDEPPPYTHVLGLLMRDGDANVLHAQFAMTLKDILYKDLCLDIGHSAFINSKERHV